MTERTRTSSATGAVPITAPVLSRNPLSAGGWSGLSFIAGNLIGGLLYIPLARRLTPADFGLFAEANLLFLALNLLAEGAVLQVLVQLRGDPDRLARAALWLGTALGLLGTVLCLLGAPLLAAIYDDPVLVPLLALMAPGIVLAGLGVVPHALLARALDFRRKTLPETLSVAVGGAAALAAAFAGLGAYSLGLMSVVQPAVSTATAWWVAGRRPRWSRPDRHDLRRLTRLWAGIAAGDVALYARLNTDYALTGRLLGAEALGVYSVAWATSAGPLLFITAFTGRVSFAVFSHLQHDRPRLRRVFLSAVRVIAAAAVPVFLAAVVLTPDLVPVLLGRRWQAAVAPAAVLFGLQLARTLAGPGASLVLALGHGRLYALLGLAALPATVLAVLIGTHGGVTGVAVAMLLAVGGTSAAYLVVGWRLAGAGARDALAALRPGGVAALVAVPTVALARGLTVVAGWPATARLAFALALGIAALIAVAWRLWPGLRTDLERLRRAG